MISGEQPVINGPGTQTRDYTFVGDVAHANLLALSFDGSEVFNVGTGVEHDVNFLFRQLSKSLRPDCPERHGEAKAGEQQRSIITAEKMYRTFGWRPMVRLDEGLEKTAHWFKDHAGR
jgi:UDP-glucose 4-epimerase